MSGEVEEDRERYNAMVQKINSNNRNNNVTQSEEPINTQQFYRGNMTAFGQSSRTATSTYAPSENSVFKLPNTVQSHSNWVRIEGAVNAFTNSFRSSDIDRIHQKLWVRSSFEILLLAQQYPQIRNEDQLIDMMCQRLKEKFYGSRNHIKGAFPHSGLHSETSQIDSYGSIASLSTVLSDNRENREFTSTHFPIPVGQINPYIAMNRINPLQSQNSVGQTNTYVAMDRNTTLQPLNRIGQTNTYVMDRNTTIQPQNQVGQTSTYIGMDRNTTLQPQNQVGQTNTCIGMDRNTTLQLQNRVGQTSTYIGMDRNTTLQAQNQVGQTSSYIAMERNTTLQPQNRRGGRGRKVRPLKSPNQVLKVDRAFLELNNTNQRGLDVSKNDTLSGVKGMSRFGRQIKSPNQFWKGIEKKMNEPSIINYSRSNECPQTTSPAEDLNETRTLRNNKVIVKNTPLPKGKKTVKNTLSVIEEQKNKPVSKTKQEPKKNPGKRKSPNKENSLTAAKEKQVPKKVSSKVVKKPSAKRKSKNFDLSISKRKKVEERLLSDCSLSSDSDELFEPLFGKKRMQPSNQVVSPSNGLHSVKKAQASSYSKETPPAKLISQLIEPDVVPTSTAKGAPETTLPQVVKRVTKMVEKQPKKVIKKTGTTKNTTTEDPRVEQIMNDVISKSTYTSDTAMGKTTYTVFRRTKVNSSEESSMSEDDMDEDIL